MSIKAVLFDLDGTLLPMDQDKFIEKYFGMLAAKFAPYGYDPKDLIKAVWIGVSAMVSGDGTKRNEETFWDSFVDVCGEKCREHMPVFEDFYANDFDKVSAVCGFNENSNKTVKALKSKGIRIILATNPVFPAVATLCRMKWAGLDKNDFELITTYENSCSTKPGLIYYREILEKVGLTPSECIMVGNDVNEDMVARELGIKVFLLTDCLINKDNKDISEFPHGGFLELNDFLENNI